MKTTIDISEPLLQEARKAAASEGKTLRALVEQGLRQVIAERAQRKPFRMRDARFDGKTWLRPELRDAGWDAIRDIIYDGRST